MKRFSSKFREYRSQKLSPLGRFLLSLGITANRMTLLSVLFGLSAVYFLFTDHLFFVIFAVLHLIADGLDGVIARLSTETRFGRYADSLTDNSITLLVLLKIGWSFQDYYAYIIAGLFLLAYLVHIISRFNAPMLFMRTILLLLLMLPLHSIEVLAYLVVGVAAVYSLTLQMQYYVRMIHN